MYTVSVEFEERALWHFDPVSRGIRSPSKWSGDQLIDPTRTDPNMPFELTPSN